MNHVFRNTSPEHLKAITRRHFFGKCAGGIGAVALASLLQGKSFGAESSSSSPTNPFAPRMTHFAPTARRVIYLHMAGAPSNLDLFDHKPKLKDLDGEPIPQSIIENERFAFIEGVPNVLASPYTFSRHGQSGAEISELLPHLAEIADEVAIIKSMYSDQFNHAPAQLFLHTGEARPGKPSMGAWLTYGLGSESEDLPGFVVLASGGKSPDGGAALWGNGFLPSVYQGVQCRSEGDPVLYVSNPDGLDGNVRRRSIDAINDLNRIQHREVGDPETLTRIAQYELAYRMQTSVPEVMDISREPESIQKMYGAEPGKVSFANNCLLARRMIEQGTRFVQLYDWGWDSHGTGPHDDIVTSLPNQCERTDRPSAALVKDLKQRGLLEDTLVIWGGEFGRTPMNEARNGSTFLGRDHHPHCFSIWMAGGGIKPGITYGATDEIGYHITESPTHVHDLQATILHTLGLDHEKLTYRFQGRDFRLTDVSGHVVKDILA